jgi:hypothetical protein
MIFRRDRYMRGGDHTGFSEQGYPAVRLTEYEENYDHQHQKVRTDHGRVYGDLPEFCDFDYIANVARANVVMLASLARAPDTPRNVRLVTDKLSHDTVLRWNRNSEPDLAGYEVVWRDTTAPDWQTERAVGDAVEARLPLSKDIYVFGVRAVDRDGHRSPVMAALPATE